MSRYAIPQHAAGDSRESYVSFASDGKRARSESVDFIVTVSLYSARLWRPGFDDDGDDSQETKFLQTGIPLSIL
jgi:hypothetical protein